MRKFYFDMHKTLPHSGEDQVAFQRIHALLGSEHNLHPDAPQGFIVDFTLNDDGRVSALEAGFLLASQIRFPGASLAYKQEPSLYEKLSIRRPANRQRPIIEFFANLSDNTLLDVTVTSAVEATTPHTQKKLPLSNTPIALPVISEFVCAMSALGIDIKSYDLMPTQFTTSDGGDIFSDPDKIVADDLFDALQAGRLPAGMIAACCSKAIFSHRLPESILPHTTVLASGDADWLRKAQEFLKTVKPGTPVVVKPVNQSMAIGVRVIKQEELIAFLTAIANGTTRDEYWQAHASPTAALTIKSPVILQEYCPSKCIARDGELFQPTGRVVFVPNIYTGVVDESLDCLHAYWKLPTQPVSEAEPHEEQRVISAVHGEDSVLPMSVDDKVNILAQLKPILAEAFDPEIKMQLGKIELIARMRNDKPRCAMAIAIFLSQINPECASAIFDLVTMNLCAPVMKFDDLRQVATTLQLFWKHNGFYDYDTVEATTAAAASATQPDVIDTVCSANSVATRLAARYKQFGFAPTDKPAATPSAAAGPQKAK